MRAIPAAPKKEAVTIPSILPLDFHSFSTWSNLGISTIEPISRAAKRPSIWSIRNMTSITCGEVSPV